MPITPKPLRITEITRRQIVDRLLLDETEPFHGQIEAIPFLRRVWPLSEMPSTDSRFKDAEGDIWQHTVRNNDWSDSELLYHRLGIEHIPDEQFARFLENRVHPLTCPDSERAQALVRSFNAELKNDGFEMRQSGEISGRPLHKVVSADATDGWGDAYEVVLSFAGEDREYAARVAEVLKKNDVSLFYDDYEEATLWGKNLTEHLHKVYGGSARYCVMFVSKHYAEKAWPTHERRSAFEKAIRSKGEYILPARFDDTEIPGLLKDICYIDLRKKSSEQLALLILQKLGRVEDATSAQEYIPF